ncbi:MAG: MarP family serine protease [Gaiella sp.]
MNAADWIALVLVALTMLSGIRRGLVTGVLSLAGLVVGGVLGARLAPDLVGDGSRYVPLVALGGAAACAMLGQTVGGLAGTWVRRTISIVPPLRLLDSFGGVVLGACIGLALCWVGATVLLYVPGQSELRRNVQESAILSALTDALPPSDVMDALGRVDEIAALIGPSADVDAPVPAIGRDPDVRAARASVVRVRGIACGLGVEGSGWIGAPELVVTNAHVVAGVDRPLVDRGDERTLRAKVVSFDARNDVAVLRVPGLRGTPLLAASRVARGTPGALLGFPANGPYTVTPVRIGRTLRVNARDAYDRPQVERPVVTLRGSVRGGNSGGPAVNANGRVLTTVFAKRRAANEGYGVPNEVVRSALAETRPARATECVAR